MAGETVVRSVPVPSPAAAEQYLRSVGAKFRKNDEVGRPLYKSQAGVVFRVNAVPSLRVEVLANCAC